MKIGFAAAIAAVTFALGGCATTGASGSAGEPIVGPIREGRCHMNGCSWFQVQSFEIVRETGQGALLRVVAREGSSMHPDGNYPRRPRAETIQWAPESTETYYFCSARYPALMFRNETGGGYDGYRLDMTMSAGATEFVQNQYRAICHPDGALDVDTAEAARRLGYTSYEGPVEFTIARPEDLFERVR